MAARRSGNAQLRAALFLQRDLGPAEPGQRVARELAQRIEQSARLVLERGKTMRNGTSACHGPAGDAREALEVRTHGFPPEVGRASQAVRQQGQRGELLSQAVVHLLTETPLFILAGLL